MRDWIRANPLVTFFALAFGLTWPLTFLLNISLLFGLLGLFGPAVAALVVSAALDGRAGVRQLLGKVLVWRVSPIWYLLAILVPVAVSGIVALEARSLGLATEIKPTQVSSLSLVLFVLVVGEELGWRGFAQPRLMARFGHGRASLVLGVLWGLWHLPTFFIAGTPQSQMPFLAFMAYTTALAGAFTWLWINTRGSVLLATIFHGSANALGFTATGLGRGPWVTLSAGLWAFMTVALLILGQERTSPTQEAT